MGNAATIMATLELTRGKFKTEVEQTEADLEKVQATFKETSAAVAVLERELKSDRGNKALKDNLSTLKSSLRETGQEMKLLERQKRDLDKVMESREAQAQKRAGGVASGPADPPIVYDDESPRKGSRRSGSSQGEDEGEGSTIRGARPVHHLFRALSSGQDPSDAVQMVLPHMMQDSGFGMGSLVSVFAGGAIIKGIQSAIEKARELRKELSDAFNGSGTGFGTASESGIKKQIEDVAALRDKLNPDGPNMSIAGWVGNKLQNGFRTMKDVHSKSVEDENQDHVEALEQRRSELSEELVKRKAAQVDLDKRAAAEGEDAVAIDRERLSLKEKIQAVSDDKNMDATAQAHMIDLLKEESAEREKHIALVQQKQRVEDEAHHANAMDRRNGQDTDVTKAQHAFDEATKKRDLLPYNGREWNAANDDATDKEADLRKAKQEQAERAAERRDAGSIAAMTGTDAARQRKTLEDEQARMRAQLDRDSKTYEPNEEKRDEIEKKQLPEVASKLRDVDAGDAQREFERRKNEIAANTGVGTREKLQKINDSLGLNQDEQNYNASHKGDVVVASQLTAEAADLKRQKKEIEISSAHELAAAIAQTQEMQLQATGQQTAAQVVGIRAQYEERITAALRNGNDELAAQYKLQEKMSVQAAQLKEFRKTPKERSQEEYARQKDEQDLKQMGVRQKRELESKRQNYEDQHRATLDLDPKKRAAQIAAAVPDLDGVLTQKTESGKARESTLNASDAAFDKRFHPDQKPAPQPVMPPVPRADPQQQASADDSNIGDVVDVLESINDLLDERLKLTIP